MGGFLVGLGNSKASFLGFAIGAIGPWGWQVWTSRPYAPRMEYIGRMDFGRVAKKLGEKMYLGPNETQSIE